MIFLSNKYFQHRGATTHLMIVDSISPGTFSPYVEELITLWNQEKYHL
jgi:hypothetical protein